MFYKKITIILFCLFFFFPVFFFSFLLLFPPPPPSLKCQSWGCGLCGAAALSPANTGSSVQGSYGSGNFWKVREFKNIFSRSKKSGKVREFFHFFWKVRENLFFFKMFLKMAFNLSCELTKKHLVKSVVHRRPFS